MPRPGGPPAAMFMDVRPALDTVGAAWDRLTMQVTKMTQKHSCWRYLAREDKSCQQCLHCTACNVGVRGTGSLTVQVSKTMKYSCWRYLSSEETYVGSACLVLRVMRGSMVHANCAGDYGN